MTYRQKLVELRANKELREKAGFTGFFAKSTDEVLEIQIYDFIDSDDWWGGVSPGAVQDALDSSDAPKVRVRLNSPGGDAFAGIAIRNLLSGDRRYVEIVVDGLAASATSVIATAGDEVIMNTGSMLMIHKAWTWSIGNADDLRDQAKMLDKLDGNIASIYSEKNGKTKKEMLKLMADETWFDADEAVESGLATSKMSVPTESDSEGDDMDVAASMRKHVAFAFNHLFTAERGAQSNKPTGENTMSDKQLATLEVQVENLSKELAEVKNERKELKDELAKFKSENTTLRDEAKAQAEKMQEIQAKAADAEKRVIEQEIHALVGVKITADEESKYVKLALENKELCQELIDARPDLKLLDRNIADKGGKLENIQPSPEDGNAMAEVVSG